MKQRSLGKMFGLFLVTFGIYRLYWLVSTRKELIAKTGVKIPSIWLLAIPYLLLIGALAGMIYSGITSEINRIDEVNVCVDGFKGLDIAGVEASCEDKVGPAEAGAVYNISVGAVYIISIFIWPLIGWWYWKYAQAVEKVTNNKMSFPVAMLVILAVPDLFDMLIVQDSFNNIGAQTKGVQQ